MHNSSVTKEIIVKESVKTGQGPVRLHGSHYWVTVRVPDLEAPL